jgi:hypothetical protein
MQTHIPAATEAMAAVAAVDLVKVHGNGDTAVRALDGVAVGFARAVAVQRPATVKCDTVVSRSTRKSSSAA